MTLCLVPLLFLDLRDDFVLVAWLLFLHAFAAATQDVAIDAWCISLIDPSERGAYNGWMQAGMLVGRSIMGGGALILRPLIGDASVVILLCLLTGFSMLLVLQARSVEKSEETLDERMVARAREVLRIVWTRTGLP